MALTERQLTIADFEAIPLLDLTHLDGRFVSSLMFYEAGAWRCWMLVGDRLLEIKNAQPAEMFYFARMPESQNDVGFHFLDFIAQRASYLSLIKPIQGLQDDIFNLSASLSKISHIHATSESIGHGGTRMVVTEIEYLFSLCRSLFDLLQEIIASLWDNIKLNDSKIKKNKLPASFADVIKVKTEEELMTKFGLPQQLAAYYIRNAGFFLLLRSFRDNVIHRGSRVPPIFFGEKGYLISQTLRPFADIAIWRDEEIENNELVPLAPALGMAVYKTLAACEDFSSTIVQVIKFPEPLVPGMRLFMRGYFNEHFHTTLQDAINRLPKDFEQIS